jgi:hypothetical protein
MQDNQDKEQVRMKCRLQQNKTKKSWRRRDRPRSPHSLLYSAFVVSSWAVKLPGRGVNHPPPSSAEVKESVDLHFHAPSRPSLSVPGRIFFFFAFYALFHIILYKVFVNIYIIFMHTTLSFQCQISLF